MPANLTDTERDCAAGDFTAAADDFTARPAATLLQRLASYGKNMAPHHRERLGGKLLIEAYAELKRLTELVQRVRDLSTLNPQPSTSE